MRLSVSHHTTYQYGSAVRLGVHHLLLTPIPRPWLAVGGFTLEVSPNPAGRSERIDAEGNPYHQLWFGEVSDYLEIKTAFTVEAIPHNPFAFIVDTTFLKGIGSGAPGQGYPSEDRALLSPYLDTEASEVLRGFGGEIWEENSGDVVAYLARLVAEIHSGWTHVVRPEADLWTPEETFEAKRGSCRDLAWMCVHMLRRQGLAARFVSGYAYNPSLGSDHELHAWVDVYLPGAGWIGLDPSIGLFTEQNYVPLACSALAWRTLPVHGSYKGGSDSVLTTSVNIEALDI